MKVRGRGLIGYAGSLLLRPLADMFRQGVSKARHRVESSKVESKEGQGGQEAQRASEQTTVKSSSSQAERTSTQGSATRGQDQRSAPRAVANDNDTAARGQDQRSAPRAVIDNIPETADERTIRRIAEAQHGGISSQESALRYARGENPGGLHHKAVRHDGPEHQRPELEEPQERKQTVPGGEKHIAVNRKGS